MTAWPPSRPAARAWRPVALCLGAALAGPAAAHAGDALPDAPPGSACTAPLSVDQLEEQIARARKALMDEDLATVDAVQADLVATAPCLDAVVDPDRWARHLVSLAIAAYVRNEDWQTPLASALAASPTVNRVVRGDTLFARWTPPAIPPTTGRVIPMDIHVWVDGRRVTVAEPLRGPHLVQVEIDGRLVSRLVDGDGTDAIWQELLPASTAQAATPPDDLPASPPPDAAARSSVTPWLVAGGATAALGAGTGIVTWSMRAEGDRDPSKQDALVAGNVAGWSVAAVGAVLAGVGLVQALDAGPTVRLGPATLTIEGRFR